MFVTSPLTTRVVRTTTSMLFLTIVSAEIFAVCLLEKYHLPTWVLYKSSAVIRAINRPYPWLAIVRTSNVESFHIERIGLLMSLRSEGKVN